MDFSFLQTIKIVDSGRSRKPKTLNPTGLTIRLYNNGEVYPSEETVNKFNLNYSNRGEQNQGNAFDVIDTSLWQPLAQYPKMIMLGLTSKESGKVDLFGSTKYNEDNTPKANVLTQGSVDNTLLNLVKAMGWIKEEDKYVDLEINTTHPVTTEDGIAYIPKTISRGKDAGQLTYVRRENSTFYPLSLVPAENVVVNESMLVNE